jgi:deoxyribodipyrimidine photo-lyase
MKAILFHDEMLNPAHPLITSMPETQALARLFVFDPTFIASEGWSLKRVQFIADCMVEIPAVEVFHGALANVCRSKGISTLVTERTPNTRINRWLERAGVTIEFVEPIAFANIDTSSESSLKRFSHYWSKVEREWFPK